jgi:nucleotide-binding universal stress UspA family protein
MRTAQGYNSGSRSSYEARKSLGRYAQKEGPTMYQTILVPLDGSAFGERALPIATSLARAMGAQLILVRASSASVLPGAEPTKAQCEAAKEAQAYLSAIAAGLSEDGLRVEVATPFGDAGESILLEIRARNADLVVMCTHGRSGLGRWIYGSVAEKVLARSPVPVLLVHPTGEVASLGAEPARAALLVPLDGSDFAEMALPHAVTLASVLGGRLLLLSVIARPEVLYGYPEVVLVQQPVEEQHQAAESYLERVAQRLRSDGVSVQTIVVEGWPSHAIVDRAVELGSRVIVMATHGRSGVARLLLGSVALDVVRRTHLPVLLVRPTDMEVAAST